MGGFSAAVENGQNSQPSSKGGASSTPPKPLDGVQNGYFSQPPSPGGKGGGQQGQQGSVTYPATSGQQQMGSPNPYPNTIGQWDNAQIQPTRQGGGKGKGY